MARFWCGLDLTTSAPGGLVLTESEDRRYAPSAPYGGGRDALIAAITAEPKSTQSTEQLVNKSLKFRSLGALQALTKLATEIQQNYSFRDRVSYAVPILTPEAVLTSLANHVSQPRVGLPARPRQHAFGMPGSAPPVPIAAPLAAALGYLSVQTSLSESWEMLVLTTGLLDRSRSPAVQLIELVALHCELSDHRLHLTPLWFRAVPVGEATPPVIDDIPWVLCASSAASEFWNTCLAKAAGPGTRVEHLSWAVPTGAAVYGAWCGSERVCAPAFTSILLTRSIPVARGVVGVGPADCCYFREFGPAAQIDAPATSLTVRGGLPSEVCVAALGCTPSDDHPQWISNGQWQRHGVWWNSTLKKVERVTDGDSTTMADYREIRDVTHATEWFRGAIQAQLQVEVSAS